MLTAPVLIKLGQLSYGIYLWHYPVVRYLRADYSLARDRGRRPADLYRAVGTVVPTRWSAGPCATVTWGASKKPERQPPGTPGTALREATRGS